MKLEYGPVQWIEQLSPATTMWSIMSISSTPQLPYGLTVGSRSSDTENGTLTATFIGVHDSPKPNASQWPLYVEGWTRPGSHPNGTIFPEIGMINQRGSCSDITPYTIGAPGQINALRLGVGKPGCNSSDISAFITFLNVEGLPPAVARLGLVFDAWCLKMVSGIKAIPNAIGRAINLATNHAIQWWDKNGKPSSTIVCDTTDAQHGVCIRLSNDSIHFGSHADGWDHFSFNCKTGAFYMGSGAIGPNNTIRVFVAGRSYLLQAKPE
jgi:hypothetical protein